MHRCRVIRLRLRSSILHKTTTQGARYFSSSKHLAYELMRSPAVTKVDHAQKLKTIVMMHGILGSRGNWRTFSRNLVAKFPKFQILLIDHRAHGDSPSFSSPHTAEACAQDVANLLSKLDITVPDIVCGHSFGGKIALSFLKHSIERKAEMPRSLPRHTWVLDALPGTSATDYPKSHSTSAAETVLPILQSIQLPIESKKSLLSSLMSHGLPKAQASWLMTNVKPDGEAAYTWKCDLDTIDALYKSFLSTDFWPFLSTDHHGASIHFVRASRNALWTNPVLKRFQQLEASHGHVKLHELQDSDHWVHIDNPGGLFNLLSPTLSDVLQES